MRMGHMTVPNLPYSWSTAWGEDECGFWTEFEIQGVAQRMRWIEPGIFRMGSPPNEPERLDDETQHEVELTEGFWLADTVCTQKLWQAATGSNPSGFKGAERPVDTVSYEDCRQFLEKLNSLKPDLELCLPTEAQWEYACRARTETPFWFGDTINTRQVNYDGFSPYNRAEGDLSWQETVEVKALPHNRWGLYQMHGNVREWCLDWYGEYESGKAIDPQGPPAGEVRVLRGGSWFSRGRGCRSAARLARVPIAREDNYGFRLCRGP
jgi:formylglycine-generating enzyme required for sulfatase activity